MAERESFSTKLDGGTLTVRFLVNSLVFPDQIRPLEEDIKAPPGDASVNQVVLDCTGVDHISSSIWGEMIRLSHAFKEQGGKLRITSMGQHVQEAFDVMNLGEVLET